MKPIRRVAVLGAGTMGSRIAAHFANAHIPSLLLDITAQAARAGVEAALKGKPGAFFTATGPNLITTGSFDDNLPAIRDCDWILEAIVERLDIKQALLARLEPHRRQDAIVSSTAGVVGVRPIDWQNRPTFQQVVAFTGHRRR